MADAAALARLEAVAALRRRRLEREASEAREAAEQARRAAEAAAASHARALGTARAAQAVFARDPVCPQTRLWRDLSRARRAEKAEAACDARHRYAAAEHARQAAIAVVLKHKRKEETLGELATAIRRAAECSAEARADEGEQKRMGR